MRFALAFIVARVPGPGASLLIHRAILILPRNALVICILLVSFVVALSMLAEPANAQGVTFRNTEFKFRFVYPSDWTQQTPRGPNVRALIRGPTGRISNCNIVVRRAPELAKLSRKELLADSLLSPNWSADDWREMFSDVFSNLKIIESRLTKASNYPVQFAIVEGEQETVAAKIHMVMAQFMTITPGVFWNFGCSAGGTTLEQARQTFQQMRPQLLGILSSFVFEDQFY